MVRRIAGALGILALALVLALLSAWWVIFHAPRSLAITNGPWRMSAVTGGTDADLYTRAVVAVTGLFALNQSETIYFSAEQSDTHQRLRARCSYAIEGKSPLCDIDGETGLSILRLQHEIIESVGQAMG